MRDPEVSGELGQFELASLVRNLRLQNPYDTTSIEYSLWDEQSQFNVPLLTATITAR